LTLAAFSVAAGALILWVFKLTTNQRALKTARRRMRAQLLAIRLFGDDPATVLRSQGRLFYWTLSYMILLLPAFLIIAIPLFFAWDRLDAVWGRSPFKPGDAAVVTARLREQTAHPQLIVPDWVVIESPAVHAEAGREVSWRVRIQKGGSGAVSILDGGQRVSKRVETSRGLHYLADREGARDTPVEWIEIRYPRTSAVNWAVWFFAISTATALALRRKLRVTF
jgi:hypothetical protein